MGITSLAEELRAIRTGKTDSKNGHGRKDTSLPNKPDRPWQADVDQMQRNLAEVLQAISRLCGVEVSALSADSPKGDGPPPQLDLTTLKDRIRNDLEAFSVITAAEVAERAKEQARAALATIQTEANVRGEQPEQGVDLSQQGSERVAELIQARTDEFARWVWQTCDRTGAPIPAQIEKMLEPYVEEANARFEGAFRQKVEDLLAGSEQSVQQRLQESIGSLQSQVSTLEQSAQQICQQSSDSAAKASTERLSAAAEDTAKNFESRIRDRVEGAISQMQARVEELERAARESLQHEEELKKESFRQELERLGCEAHEKITSEISTRVEHTAADAVGPCVQHLHQQADDALEHSRGELQSIVQLQVEEAKKQITDLAASVHEQVSQDAVKMADALGELEGEFSAIAKKHLDAVEERFRTLSQAAVESLSTNMKQMGEARLEEVSKRLQEFETQAASQYESRLREITDGEHSKLQELSNKVNVSASLAKEEEAQVTCRIESALNDSLETFRQQLGQISDTGIEEHRKAIMDSINDLHSRLKKAADLVSQAV